MSKTNIVQAAPSTQTETVEALTNRVKKCGASICWRLGTKERPTSPARFVFTPEQLAAFAAPTAPSATIAAREQEATASKMEVDSWRRALLVWRDAGISELIEDRAGLKQCLSNAARLLLDHPALATPTAPKAHGGRNGE